MAADPSRPLAAPAPGAADVAEALRVKTSKDKLDSLMSGFDKFETVMKQGTRVRPTAGRVPTPSSRRGILWCRRAGHMRPGQNGCLLLPSVLPHEARVLL